MTREDFEGAAYEDAAGFAAALRRIWQNETRIDLAASVEKHAEVARALGEVAEQQTEEVSPFIYVMF
jgi:hypothetical protein